MATNHAYLIALGSNQRHHLLGPPAKIIAQAFAALEMADISVFKTSPVIASKPVGPSQRQYANAAATVLSPLSPDTLLDRLKSLEAHFGRRAAGQRWRARVLDLDILLWSGGAWIKDDPPLIVPHREMQHRRFVLQPAAEIAADWRDPITGHQIKHLLFRINHAKPLDPMHTAN